jgi:hypothetical protein
VIGGNLGIYYNVQTAMGKVMIWMCHKYKLKRLNHIKTESIEMKSPV